MLPDQLDFAEAKAEIGAYMDHNGLHRFGGTVAPIGGKCYVPHGLGD